MTRVKDDQRKRAKKPKTRTGCYTCKVRRIKCDEARPACIRCTSTGRKCDGYNNDIVAIQRPALLPRPADAPTILLLDSFEEQRALSYFACVTRKDLPGAHECDFWDSTVLQAVVLDTGMRHAVLALSAFHEAFQHGHEGNPERSSFALSQYNLAIGHQLNQFATSRSTPANVHTYLATCMLFICIELLQTHYLSALSLIRGAIKIYNDISENEWRDSAWPLRLLGSQLGRLQSQAAGLLGPIAGAGSASPAKKIPIRLKGSAPMIPTSFSSIAQATSIYEFYAYDVGLEGQKGLATAVELGMDPASLVNQWAQAFRSFEATTTTTTTTQTLAEKRATTILKIRVAFVGISLSALELRQKGENEMLVWDRFEGAFQDIVDMAGTVVDTPEELNVSLRRARKFTLGYGIIGPLYDTVFMCRNPRIRRQAVALLRRHACREGLWDSILAANVAEKLIELEEGAIPDVRCASDVPMESRIVDLYPQVEPEDFRADFLVVRRQHSLSPGIMQDRLEEQTLEW